MSNVEALKQKLHEWTEWLSGSDVHAISAQIRDLLWRSAFYRSINVSRRFLRGDSCGKRANGLLHDFIDQGYFTMHAAAIRRLLDKKLPSGDRGVYSLWGLIKDIKENSHLLTRANALEARNLEYNYEPIMERAREEARPRPAPHGEPVASISRNDWFLPQYWHEQMDKLCSVNASRRSPDDVPPVAKFDGLWERISHECKGIKEYVDKHIAHAASPASMERLAPNHLSICLAKLWLAERVVVRVANFVSLSIVT